MRHSRPSANCVANVLGGLHLAKAPLVMRLRVNLAAVEPVSDLSVGRLLDARPRDLGEVGVAPETARRLQETLADLEIALYGAQLQAITLGS